MYKLLDLFCGAGGAAKGYHDAGFEVVGVDIVDRPHYPYKFIKADALEVLKDEEFVNQFQAIHASPPCQRYSKLRNMSNDKEAWDERHPDLVDATRVLLKKTGKPYIIENVVGAPLVNPITLYGTQFPHLYTQRPRLFESNIPLKEPEIKKERMKTGKLGSGPAEDGFITVAGIRPERGMTALQTKLYYGFALGGIDWMDLDELVLAIPPAYTEFIGKQMINHLDNQSIKFGVEMDQMLDMLAKVLAETMMNNMSSVKEM